MQSDGLQPRLTPTLGCKKTGFVQGDCLMNKIKTASVQFNHKPGNKDYNFGKILEFVESAADEKVD